MRPRSILLPILATVMLCSCGTKGTIKGIEYTYLNDNGELVIVYTDGTEDNEEGSWDVSYKFGPLEEGTEIHDLSEQKYHVGIIKRGSIAGFEFQDPSLIYTLLLSFANAINEYLDKVANPAETVETYLDGYFTIKVDVVNDQKIFNLIIDEPIVKAVVGSDKDEKAVKA